MTQEPSFSTFNIDDLAFPVLIAVPHSGREYPLELLQALRVDPAELLRLEDRYSDRLAQKAIKAGVPAIIMHKARAWIDLNRAEEDYDASMFDGEPAGPAPICSAKTRGGLGLIPRRLHGCGELWKRRFTHEELISRIETDHRPYHAKIDSILAAMRDRFGTAVLLDLHSMPPLTDQGFQQNPVRCVVGDRFGQSAGAQLSETVLSALGRSGMQCALNNPYPGDFTLRRHGQVRRNIHAIQLEFDRSLYLDATMREPTSALSTIALLVRQLAEEIATLFGSGYWAEAAE